MQHQCTAALVKAEQLSHCSVLLCKTGSQQPCATAITLMEVCSLYRCALMQHLCTAALVKAEQLACCSVLLCKNMFTAALCHYSYTYGDLLFIQVCSDATPMHCNTGHGRTAGLLFSAALQNRLTAALCHCSYTYEDLLFIQVCSDAAPMHCSTGQGRTASLLFSAALQKQGHSSLVPLQLYLWRSALHTGVH